MALIKHVCILSISLGEQEKKVFCGFLHLVTKTPLSKQLWLLGLLFSAGEFLAGITQAGLCPRGLREPAVVAAAPSSSWCLQARQLLPGCRALDGLEEVNSLPSALGAHRKGRLPWKRGRRIPARCIPPATPHGRWWDDGYLSIFVLCFPSNTGRA